MQSSLAALPQVWPFPIILFDLAAAGALFAVAVYVLAARSLGPRLIAFAAPPLVAAGLLVLYVLSEDSYRGGGISRWDAYAKPGGALVVMFWASLAVLILGGLLLAWSSRRDRSLFVFTAIATGSALLLLVVPTILGFSLN
jgi:hypothetical protein